MATVLMYQWPLLTWLTCWNCMLWRILNHHQPLEQVLFPKFNLNHWTEMSTRSIVPPVGNCCGYHWIDLTLHMPLRNCQDLTAPTTESITKVKDILRYIAGTRDHCQRLCPNAPLESSICTLDCYVDSDWAGCRSTRKSTSGTVAQILNSTVSFGSRTQATIALCSGVRSRTVCHRTRH